MKSAWVVWLAAVGVAGTASADPLPVAIAWEPDNSGLTFSGSPLLFPRSFFGEVPPVRDADGAEVAIVRVEDPDLVGSLPQMSAPATIFRATEPLRDGGYTYTPHGIPFTVSSTPTGDGSWIDVDVIPDVSGARMRVGGIVGNPPQLRVVFPTSVGLTSIHRLVVEPDSGPAFALLFTVRDGRDPIIRAPEGTSPYAGRFCARLTGVSWSGRVGAPVDLGCADARDLDDPNVEWTEASGCSGMGASGWTVGVVLVVGWLGARRRTSRPRRHHGDVRR